MAHTCDQFYTTDRQIGIKDDDSAIDVQWTIALSRGK